MVIDLQNISWVRQGKQILTDVSWQVNRGENWCLVGLNGSGKTTLLNILTGYIWPSTGSVTVLGQRYGTVKLPEFRKRIGLVSSSLQQRFYGHETAEEVVMSGKFATIGLYDGVEADDEQRARELLVLFGCEKLIGRQYHTFSQGEQQKVLIARALMASPDILILDEPCTGLDLLAREQVLAMISDIASKPNAPTLIYVTHHIEEIVPCFTHTLLLKEGTIFETGATEQVLDAEALSRFFGVPVEVHERENRKWIVASL